MIMAKKKLSYMQRRQKEEKINTKALVWIGVSLGIFIVAMSILLAFNQ